TTNAATRAGSSPISSVGLTNSAIPSPGTRVPRHPPWRHREEVTWKKVTLAPPRDARPAGALRSPHVICHTQTPAALGANATAPHRRRPDPDPRGPARTPSCRCGETSSVLFRSLHLPVDDDGSSA